MSIHVLFNSFTRWFFPGVVLVLLALGSCTQEKVTNDTPPAKIIVIDTASGVYQEALSGPPESLTMRSGLVTLAPGESAGEHSTESFEELVVVFRGRGEMRIKDGAILSIGPERLAYCPPNTTHDVVNTGTSKLQYLYVVAEGERRSK
ncbi:MAG: cupin domain-containing protein [Chlorobi bacterium]|nr:cupin domain-containing protein [Chlorobiota bacterium]